jgi:hypothetical protein
VNDRPDLRAQRAYRKRRAEKIMRYETALAAIITELTDKTGPVATKCRQIADGALNGASA